MRLKGEWKLRRQRQGGEYRAECAQMRQSKSYLRNYKDCRLAEVRVGVGKQVSAGVSSRLLVGPAKRLTQLHPEAVGSYVRD